MMDYYTLNIFESTKSLKSSEQGLTKTEAEKRIREYGYNELQKEKRLAALNIFVNQFKNTLSLLLIFAGFLSLFLGETIESIAMFAIVILNAVLGFFQEYKAEKTLESLEKLSAPTAKVLRDGQEQKIPAWKDAYGNEPVQCEASRYTQLHFLGDR